MSLISKICFPGNLDFKDLSKDQVSGEEFIYIISSLDIGLHLKLFTMSNTISKLHYDIRIGKFRPCVTSKFRKHIYQDLHCLLYLGIRATLNLI